MKNFFFFLLLVNVVFYLWETNINTENRSSSPLIMVDSGLDTIALAGELERASSKRSLNESESLPALIKEVKTVSKVVANNDLPPVPIVEKSPELPAEEDRSQEVKVVNQSSVPAICYLVAPFKNEKLALDFQKKSEAFFQSKIVERSAVENRGYWALYPAALDMKQAKANVRLLKEKGADELWLFRKGEHRGAISLGLFKNRQRAEKIKEKFSTKGLEIEVRPFSVEVTEFALKLSWEGDADELVERLNDYLANHPDTELITVSCN